MTSSACVIFLWLFVLVPSHAWTTTTTKATVTPSTGNNFHACSVLWPHSIARSQHQNNVMPRKHSTCLHLFFKSPAPSAASSTTKFVIPESVGEDWLHGVVDFPYTFTVDTGRKSTFTNQHFAPFRSNTTLTIRLMQWQDLAAIVDMCVQEYSTYGTPGKQSASLGDKLDQVVLGLYVALSMILKLLMNYSLSSKVLPNDHAILVASLMMGEESSADTGSSGSYDDDISNSRECLVGMVEVSRQPPLPERNPPAIPIPLWWKELYSNTVCKQHTQGWITNLLIVPEYRGRGWARALVMACEGLARRWKTSTINLHCDALYRTPQKLYQSLGYQPDSSSSSSSSTTTTLSRASSDYSWIPNSEVCRSSIYIIEGVPLLYLCKKL